MKPYFKFGYIDSFTGKTGSSYIVAPIDGISIFFNKKGQAYKIGFNGATGETLVTVAGDAIEIERMNAESPSDFWLKAYALGLVHEEDGSGPAEPEMEIVRLKEKIRDLEDKVLKYKNAFKIVYDSTEKLA